MTRFFAGLDNIVAMVSGRRYWLRVELHGESDPTPYYALYDNFQVAPAAQLYKLTSVGACCGTKDSGGLGGGGLPIVGKRPILNIYCNELFRGRDVSSEDGTIWCF